MLRAGRVKVRGSFGQVGQLTKQYRHTALYSLSEKTKRNSKKEGLLEKIKRNRRKNFTQIGNTSVTNKRIGAACFR
jgi:hypothetical protein